MLNKLEVLADAITYYSGYHNPKSSTYGIRNPGRLRAFSARHPRDLDGLRIFQSHVDGYQALLYDLEVKCKGLSRSKLTGESLLMELVQVYGHKPSAATAICKFIRRALDDEDIKESIEIKYFVSN